MSTPGWDRADSPFHAGERGHTGTPGGAGTPRPAGPARDRSVLTEQHRAFFRLLPYVLVGSVDGEGQPWASMLVGAPGFLSSQDEHTLQVAARPLPGDPLAAHLAEGAPLGVLGSSWPRAAATA